MRLLSLLSILIISVVHANAKELAEKIVCVPNSNMQSWDFNFETGESSGVEVPRAVYMGRKIVIQRVVLGGWYLVFPDKSEEQVEDSFCLGYRDRIRCSDPFSTIETYFESLANGTKGPYFAFFTNPDGFKKITIHIQSGECERTTF